MKTANTHRPRLLIAGIDDPRLPHSWSGIPFHASRALGDYFDIVTVGPLPKREPWYFDWLRRWYSRTGAGWFIGAFEPVVLRGYARAIEEAISRHKPDALLAVHADPVAYLETDIPIYYLHDATFAGLVEYYPEFSRLCNRTIRNGHLMQKSACQRAAGAFYSSAWAATSAVDHYSMPASKVHTTPFGANIESSPSRAEVQALIAARARNAVCEVLFLGVKWERKGGDTLIAIARRLAEGGADIVVNIAGCTPPADVTCLPFVRSFGFLSKAKADETAILTGLWASASFLVVPSKAECYGCVYCEANAFGVPAIARTTGGVSEIVRDGWNGLLMGAEESLDSFADRLLAIWNNKSNYAQMSTNARYEFESRLNWDVFSRKVSEIIMEELDKRAYRSL